MAKFATKFLALQMCLRNNNWITRRINRSTGIFGEIPSFERARTLIRNMQSRISRGGRNIIEFFWNDSSHDISSSFLFFFCFFPCARPRTHTSCNLPGSMISCLIKTTTDDGWRGGLGIGGKREKETKVVNVSRKVWRSGRSISGGTTRECTEP